MRHGSTGATVQHGSIRATVQHGSTLGTLAWLPLWLCLGSALAEAQQRPLVTEDPETIGSGLVLIEGVRPAAKSVLSAFRADG